MWSVFITSYEMDSLFLCLSFSVCVFVQVALATLSIFRCVRLSIWMNVGALVFTFKNKIVCAVVFIFTQIFHAKDTHKEPNIKPLSISRSLYPFLLVLQWKRVFMWDARKCSGMQALIGMSWAEKFIRSNIYVEHHCFSLHHQHWDQVFNLTVWPVVRLPFTQTAAII